MRRTKALARQLLPVRFWLILRKIASVIVWPPRAVARRRRINSAAPLNRNFGAARGTPVDRFYIDAFLTRYAPIPRYAVGDIRGEVLEIGEDRYARKFGMAPAVASDAGLDPADVAVTRIDVLHVDASNPGATIVGNLESPMSVPRERFDCVICTQTLQFLYSPRAAIETIHGALRPGGVALITVPGVAAVARPEADLWGDYWRFSRTSLTRLCSDVFGSENVEVEVFGNLTSTSAFLHGLAAEDLSAAELDLVDPDFPVLVAAHARRRP